VHVTGSQLLSRDAEHIGDSTVAEYASERLKAGLTAEEVAMELITIGAGPIETIKALRATTDMVTRPR
jgi:hypothetical protein